MTKLRKAEKSGRVGEYVQRTINKLENQAREKDLMLIDEYLFPHAVYKIPPKDLTMEGLKFAYSKIFDFL